jgi:hypothetical protein
VTATGEKAEEGLDWKKPKPLASSAGDQVAQADVVDEQDEADGGERGRTVGAHRHVVDDHRDLALHVDAEGLVGDADRLARGEEGVRAALIDQRVGPELRRHLGAAGLSHQFHVVHIGRAVGPLVGARQGRERVAFVEALDRLAAGLDAAGDEIEMRCDPRPVVEGALQRRRDVAHVRTPGDVLRDDDQPAVAGAVAERGELHRVPPCIFDTLARGIGTRPACPVDLTAGCWNDALAGQHGEAAWISFGATVRCPGWRLRARPWRWR